MSKFTDIFSNIIGAIFITSSDSEEDKARKIIRYAFFGSIILIFVVSWLIFVFITFGDNSVKVPNLTGDNIYTALTKISDKNLISNVNAKYSNEYPEGTVFWQNPQPSSIVKRGRVVSFNVSLGPTTNALPDLRGLTLFELSDFIDKNFADGLPFDIAKAKYEYSDNVERGRIINQNPSEGTPIKSVSTLELVISNGLDGADSSEPVLEDYKGKDMSTVVDDMSSLGLLYTIKFISGNYVKNNLKVHKQSAEPGKLLRQINEENKPIVFEVLLNSKINNNEIEGFYDITLTKKPIPYSVKVTIADKAETTSYKLLDIKTRGGVDISVPYYRKSNSKLILEIEGQDKQDISLQ